MDKEYMSFINIKVNLVIEASTISCPESEIPLMLCADQKYYANPESIDPIIFEYMHDIALYIGCEIKRQVFLQHEDGFGRETCVTLSFSYFDGKLKKTIESPKLNMIFKISDDGKMIDVSSLESEIYDQTTNSIHNVHDLLFEFYKQERKHWHAGNPRP